MEEEIMQQEQVEQQDFSKEINEQHARILEEEAKNRATDSESITAILGYLCGDVAKERIEELYDARRDSALEIIEAKKELARYDETGKLIQTAEGSGSMEDPVKGWKVGMEVEEGLWYLTEDGYLWECIKSGEPESTTDKEFFDVVGL